MQMERAQLGAWGELRVQRDLLHCCIDSARMTTDTGVDLVAYAGHLSKPFSVQVKTRTPRGKGKNYLSWGIETQKIKRADLFAFVGKFEDREEVWYVSREELKGENPRTSQPWLLHRPQLRIFRIYFKGTPTKAHVHSDAECFKDERGLQRFLDSLKKTKAAGAS